MRRIVKALVATTLATFGLLAAAPGPASAGPASAGLQPLLCESGASHFVCEVYGAAGPVAWTVTVHQSGYSNTFSFTTAGNTYSGGCAAHTSSFVAYSYSPDGVTQISGSGFFACNTGPWP